VGPSLAASVIHDETIMVFAVQCPNPKCRKFMLVEDRDRGKVVECLICKAPIKIGKKSSTSSHTSRAAKP
jgi:hypothetical protein